MLSHLIVEDIVFGIDLRSGPYYIKTDPEQFNKALTSRFLNLQTGEYVRLGVDHNSCGLDNESLIRIFEPFYTTKAKGLGTDLVLSMVYTLIDLMQWPNRRDQPGRRGQ